MKETLTDRQKDILAFIQQFKNESGYPPTLREIGKKFGISSTFGVKRHLDALIKKGYLNKENFASRGISVISENEENSILKLNFETNSFFTKIPILGRVAAGNPVTSEEYFDGSLVVDSNFINSANDYFALKVKGDSMVNVGIMEGDYVIVAVQQNADNNDIVVALIEEEATVKRFYKNMNEIKLIPENNSYYPIEVNSDKSFSIVGVVIGVVRWFK
jgi:repressor LexA